MNTKHTSLFVSIAAVFAVAAPAPAVEPDTKQSVALMGSQPAPVLVNDSAIQKAIEALIKQQQKKDVDIKRKIPNKLDNPVGQNPLRNSDKVLILGGAEAMPM
ncbi:MAG: hypothetical protein K2X27_04690 [Candidatus Obscuribacterales bacterium]|nr:hypothetical protein [Candidatus Obscuribacterales bacterium]